jgi:hypothetical protein
MSNSLDFEIREHLAEYLAGKSSLRDFEDWFFSETWDIDQTNDLALLNLVYEIKLRLAEFSNGDWTASEIDRILRSILERYEMNAPQSRVQFGTSNKNYPSYYAVPSISYHVVSTRSVQPAGIEPVKVSW